MKKSILLPIIFFLIFSFTTKNTHAVEIGSACNNQPNAGDYTVSASVPVLGCYIAASGKTNGVDNSGNSENSTTNTAKLIVPNGTSFTIPSGLSPNQPTTLVVGSLEIQNGGSVSIGTDAQIKIGVPLYMLDFDSDGRPDSLDYFTASNSGRRRRSLAATIEASDCAPTNNSKWKTYAGYVDYDSDGYGVGSINASICSGGTIDTNYVADNNTDCNDSNASLHRQVAGYIDVDSDSYGVGTYKTCVGDASPYVANNTDCDDNIAAATGKKVFGTVCTPTNYGSTDDGAVSFSGSQNINSFVNTGRSYADGVSYAVSALGTNSITLSSTPNGIVYGDEIMIINLQGDATNNSNVGNYENFYVTNVNSSTKVLTLYSNITKTYGVGNNSNLTGQKIIVQRVPNYTTVNVASGATLTTNAWNGTTGGLISFRSSATTTVTGTISTTGLGYRGRAGGIGYGGESFCGYNNGNSVYHAAGTAGTCGGGGGGFGWNDQYGGGSGSSTGGAGGGGAGADGGTGGTPIAGAGGGGGYGTFGYGGQGGGGQGGGTNGGTSTSGAGGHGWYYPGWEGHVDQAAPRGGGAGGGGTYGDANLTKLYFGSAGGQGGFASSNAQGGGGAGGGIIFINAYNLSVSGTVQSNGANGITGGGGGGAGAGGSIFIKTDTQTTISNVTVSGAAGGIGSGSGAGGSGRYKLIQ